MCEQQFIYVPSYQSVKTIVCIVMTECVYDYSQLGNHESVSTPCWQAY